MIAVAIQFFGVMHKDSSSCTVCPFGSKTADQKLSKGWYCRKLLFDHACYWISILIIKPSMFDLLEFRVEDEYVQAWFCDITTSLEPIRLHFITYTSVIHFYCCFSRRRWKNNFTFQFHNLMLMLLSQILNLIDKLVKILTLWGLSHFLLLLVHLVSFVIINVES